MRLYRYGAELRPFNQLNLNRLEVDPTSFLKDERFPFGTMAFRRQMTEFEVNQFDLTFLGEEETQ